MNSAIKKIAIAAIRYQWIKGSKDMVMGYGNNSYMDLMDWLHVRYGQVMPGYLIRNQ